MGIPYYEDCPPEWNEPPGAEEAEESAIEKVAESYLDADRIGNETKGEFRGFYLHDNIDQIICLGLKPAVLKELLDKKWRDHCIEEAMIHVKHGSYWNKVRRDYAAESYWNKEK